jgi:hypothetical protein
MSTEPQPAFNCPQQPRCARIMELHKRLGSMYAYAHSAAIGSGVLANVLILNRQIAEETAHAPAIPCGDQCPRPMPVTPPGAPPSPAA